MNQIYLLLFAIITFELNAQQTSYNFSTGSSKDQIGTLDGVFYGNASQGDSLVIGYNTADYFDIPASVLDKKMAFTLQFKVKFSSLNISGDYPTNSLFAASTANNASTFAFAYQKDQNKWMFLNGYDLLQFYDDKIVAGKWYCITLTRNENGLVKLFVDGVQNSTSASSFYAINMTSFVVGQETDCFGGCFAQNQSANASFDDIEFYNSAINVSEIKLFCEGKCNSIAFFDFNNSSNIDHVGLLEGKSFGNSLVNDFLSIGYNTSDYFELPAQLLNNKLKFSLQFNVKFNELNIQGAYPTNSLIAGSSESEASTFALAYQKDQNVWKLYHNYQVYDFYDDQVIENKWYNVVLTRSSEGIFKLFVNGKENNNSYFNSINLYMTNLIIGQETDCFGGCFAQNQSANAVFDDFVFSNCLLDINSYKFNNAVTSIETFDNSVTLYPNPVSDILSISSIENILNLEILSFSGSIIKSIQVENEKSSAILLDGLNSGFYICKVTTLSGSHFIKFVKK